MKDLYGNMISVTIFESNLSKYLLDNPQFFIPLYTKIFEAIERVIQANQHVPSFDRALFSVFTFLASKKRPQRSVKDITQNFDLLAANDFFKSFCDSFFSDGPMTLHVPKPDSNPAISTSLGNRMFLALTFAEKKKYLYTLMRPSALFSEENRGVSLLSIDEENIDSGSFVRTPKLGIATPEHTPIEYSEYFEHVNNEPSQLKFTPNRDSNVGRWLTYHNLPVVTGSSGSAVDTLVMLHMILEATDEDALLLCVAHAATLVAQGHHSYFEIFIVLHQYGIPLKSAPNLYAFYEQTLPKAITSSDSFQSFKRSLFKGKADISTITDPVEPAPECSGLPCLKIG